MAGKRVGGSAAERLRGAPEPAKGPAQALREALLSAEPGSTVTIPEGHFTFDRSLSLGVNGVTLRGAGQDKSILDFAGQLAGAEGLLVAAEDVTLEGFAVLDAKGDAIKMNQCKNLVVRRAGPDGMDRRPEEYERAPMASIPCSATAS